VRACLESLREHAARSGTTIFVVDKASSDGKIELIRSEFPDVILIANDENIGFGAANNVAILRGRGRYVLAPNPDTRVTAGALDAVIQLMDERSNVGVCGCRLVREDGSFDHASKRSFPTIAGALGHFFRVGRGSRAPKRLSQYRAPGVEGGRSMPSTARSC
jgi:GT2 family glycosyltransferase